MTKVTLHKVMRPCPGGRTRPVWMLRWYGTDGKRLGETVGECRQVSRREALAARRAKQSRLDCKLERPDRPKKMALADFAEHYKERRRRGEEGRGYMRGAPKLDERTIVEHDMTLRYLIQHFGQRRGISSINRTHIRKKSVMPTEQVESRSAGDRGLFPWNSKAPMSTHIAPSGVPESGAWRRA